MAAIMGVAGCAAQTDHCVIHPVTELTIDRTDGAPVVSASIDSVPVTFMVDTGAEFSFISSAFARVAGLESQATWERVAGLNGIIPVQKVTASSLSIGHATGQEVVFGVIDRPFGSDTTVDGLFGGDFLSNYNLDLDLVGRRIGVYKTDHCDNDDFHPLGTDAFSLPIQRLQNLAFVEVKLDGHAFPFVIDSGSAFTYVSAQAALALGIKPRTLRDDPPVFVYGVGGGRSGGRMHRFRSLELGPERLDAPELRVQGLNLNILGRDILFPNRVWIAYRSNRIFVLPLRSTLLH